MLTCTSPSKRLVRPRLHYQSLSRYTQYKYLTDPYDTNMDLLEFVPAKIRSVLLVTY